MSLRDVRSCPKAEIEIINISLYKSGAEGTVPRDKIEGIPARLDLLRDELEKRVGETVIVEIEAIPIDIVHFRSAPDGDKEQGVPLSPRIGE